MTSSRPIHDCPYCGRTKFADETLPCCVDDEYERLSPESKAQVDRAMRNYERRCKRESWAAKYDLLPKYGRGRGRSFTDEELYGE